jgi:hypothetical protein
MAFSIKRRGKVTYYFEGERPVLSALVTEQQPDGDLKIYLSGLTGGYSAKGVLGLDELVTMDPHREVALVFRCWEKWLRDAGICESLAEVDFLEVHAFGYRSPRPQDRRAGWRRVDYMQTSVGRQPFATEIGDVDYAKMAETAGLKGIRVDDPTRIGAAWDEALAENGPVLIEFMAGHDFPRPSARRFVEQGSRD